MFSLVSRLSLCGRRRGPRSDPVLSGLKKVKSLLAIFFRRENQRAIKNSFESLANSQDQEVSSKADLESIRVDFYNNLYS